MLPSVSESRLAGAGWYAAQQMSTSSRTLGIDAGATLCKLALSCDRPQTALIPSTALNAVRQQIERWQPDRILATGGGAKQLGERVAGLEPRWVSEVDAWARGASVLARRQGLELPPRYVLVSLGTGTSVLEVRGDKGTRIGGTALGGGTLIGLGRLLLKAGSFQELTQLARRGDRRKVDLLVGDIYSDGRAPLPPQVTASNFGKLASTRDVDLADALMGLLGENIALICSALTRLHGLETVVFGGSTLSDNPTLEQTLELSTRALGHRAHFLSEAAFCGAVGAAALGEV